MSNSTTWVSTARHKNAGIPPVALDLYPLAEPAASFPTSNSALESPPASHRNEGSPRRVSVVLGSQRRRITASIVEPPRLHLTRRPHDDIRAPPVSVRARENSPRVLMTPTYRAGPAGWRGRVVPRAPRVRVSAPLPRAATLMHWCGSTTPRSPCTTRLFRLASSQGDVAVGGGGGKFDTLFGEIPLEAAGVRLKPSLFG
ncbi:hypothetical protein DFH09DRAFT_1436746 [Mycena vulgaris]|nr:hypothetical protein DFH09DRAFT_1436746 [Mycena vulgaris]